MAFAIIEIDGTTAKDLEAWDWDEMIEPDTGHVQINAFDTSEELYEAVLAYGAATKK